MNQHSMNGKHMLIMLLCCVVPLGAIFLVSVFNIDLGSVGPLALVLLCPLLHILMMSAMGRGSKGQAACHETKSDEVRPAAAKQV